MVDIDVVCWHCYTDRGDDYLSGYIITTVRHDIEATKAGKVPPLRGKQATGATQGSTPPVHAAPTGIPRKDGDP